MNALGMIETYGYLAAVEALDSALKAANVSLVDAVKVKGGLVTVLIEGDVGAVKAAVDAAAAAAERVGAVVAIHVIPRPAEEVRRMLAARGSKGPGKGPGGGEPRTAGAQPGEGPDKPVSGRETAETKAGEARAEADQDPQEERKADEGSISGTDMRLPQDTDPADGGNGKAPESGPKRTAEDAGPLPPEENGQRDTAGNGAAGRRGRRAGAAKDAEPAEVPPRARMEKMTVAQLRTLARRLKITNMTAQEIRFAKKQELIQAITIFTGQER